MAKENLVLAASSFLSSPSIRKYPDEVKHKFLLQKGLNPDEIKRAFANVCKATPSKLQNKEISVMMDQCLHEDGHVKNKLIPSRPSVPIVIIAAISSATFGIVVYIFRLMKWYCWPWIMYHWNSMRGTRYKAPSSETKSVEHEDTVLQIDDLQKQIASIESGLHHQKNQLSQMSSDSTTAIEELKKDIISLRKMVLSKDSFPLPGKPAIPSWQIRKPNTNKDDTNSAESSYNSETQHIVKTVESFEEISPPNSTITEVTNNIEPDVALDTSSSNDSNVELSNDIGDGN